MRDEERRRGAAARAQPRERARTIDSWREWRRAAAAERAWQRRLSGKAAAGVGDYTLAGTLAGALLGLTPAFVGEPGPLPTLLASGLGALTGATVGLLTWLGRAELPQDRIPPAAQEERRERERR